jgi:hypothetical protein
VRGRRPQLEIRSQNERYDIGSVDRQEAKTAKSAKPRLSGQ